MEREGGRENEVEIYDVFFFPTQGADCTHLCLYVWQYGQQLKVSL